MNKERRRHYLAAAVFAAAMLMIPLIHGWSTLPATDPPPAAPPLVASNQINPLALAGSPLGMLPSALECQRANVAAHLGRPPRHDVPLATAPGRWLARLAENLIPAEIRSAHHHVAEHADSTHSGTRVAQLVQALVHSGTERAYRLDPTNPHAYGPLLMAHLESADPARRRLGQEYLAHTARRLEGSESLAKQMARGWLAVEEWRTTGQDPARLPALRDRLRQIHADATRRQRALAAAGDWSQLHPSEIQAYQESARALRAALHLADSALSRASSQH